MADSINKKVRFGPFDVDLTTHELWKNGQKLKLGGQPFGILAALLEKPGELVTRKHLRARIWSADTFVDFNHGLNAAVNKLRETLNDSAEEPRYIETLPRRGYRFIAPLDPPVTTPAPPVASAVLAPLNLDTESWAIPIGSGSRRYVWGLTGALLLVSIFGLWIGMNFYHGEPGKLERERQASKEREVLAARFAQPPGIWHLNLADPRDPKPRTVLASGKERNEGAQLSPDGNKIAFMSDRSGRMEIWTMDRDGSSPEKLTNLGNCGSPRWSPDSQWIAFDAIADGTTEVFVVASGGGPAKTVVFDGWENLVPSWSNDGKWVYFASHRSGDDQVWKVPFAGGPAVQVTRQGGFATAESFDGQTIYYAKTRFENPEIWKVPVVGGTERRVSPLLRPKMWANWALTEKGILFLNDENDPGATLEFYDFATSGVHPVSELEKPSFWLSASKDGKSAWYAWKNDEENRAALRLEFH
ncbi:MAG TPA: winged helix-turn-helix domain-containing protein [Candidatus Acidoferrum sp.]|jgi:DNA-binding winged helix-turn-helix (wHTH) protein|nr:winged helix-turn-helix domain-containing protein [Candidatus Acidoferrum sp.]